MANPHRAWGPLSEYGPQAESGAIRLRRSQMTISIPESGNSVSPDVVLSVIANEYRRAVLRSLNRTEGKEVGLSTLTDEVAEHVRGEPLVDEQRQRVRIALHHNHLPKLEECGMIVHDTETDLVRNVTGELGQKLLAVVEPYEAGE